jgi:hypothetical protein
MTFELTLFGSHGLAGDKLVHGNRDPKLQIRVGEIARDVLQKVRQLHRLVLRRCSSCILLRITVKSLVELGVGLEVRLLCCRQFAVQRRHLGRRKGCTRGHIHLVTMTVTVSMSMLGHLMLHWVVRERLMVLRCR